MSDDDSAVIASGQHRQQSPVSASELVRDEIQRYKDLGKDALACDAKHVAHWWDTRASDFPCLRKVANAIFSMLPGSGGLENDIGAFKDIISAKRESLNPGMVEVLIVVKLNKSLAEFNTLKVGELSSRSWKEKIPRCPEFPADYFDGDGD